MTECLLLNILEEGPSALVRDLSHNAHKRATYELACSIGAEYAMDVSDIETCCTEMADKLDKPNVVFKCSFLADVDTCDVECDYETATNSCCTFSKSSFETAQRLHVYDAACHVEYIAMSVRGSHSTIAPSVLQGKERVATCTVVGCPVVHNDTKGKQSFTYSQKNKRKKHITTVSGLCIKHHHRLTRNHGSIISLDRC